MLSPTSSYASSSVTECGSTTKFKGKYSTQVFHQRTIDVRIRIQHGFQYGTGTQLQYGCLPAEKNGCVR